jgi:hypothetical protein
MEYRTVVGVEIATVGMDWHASSGDHSVTFENLADAVSAANDDPHIVVPRVKIGHTSEVNGELSVVNPFAALGDAEPAFGRYVNLSLTNDGATLIGDWIEGPEWLVDAAPSAYPGRSMEARTDVVTEGGKRYSMVIVAVSLLGPIEPAIKDLEDLERFLIEGPENVTTAATRPEEERMSEQVDASVSAATIRERFNFDWATSEPIDGIDTYWWWARDVRVDPNEVIADDDEGNCWSIPFTTDGADEITFGEPVKVREEFVPIGNNAEAVAASVRQRADQRVLASNLERPEKPAPKTAASTQPDNEEDTMDAKAIRDSLGLAEDATDEEVIAKGQELREAAGAEETTEEETTAEETTETETVEEPVAASVDPAALEQLKSDAAAGREARTTQLSAERDSLIEVAVKAGKFAPAVAASYRTQLDKGGDIEASTRKFIDELAENVVPVTEIGASHQAEGGQVSRVLASFGINRG